MAELKFKMADFAVLDTFNFCSATRGHFSNIDQFGIFGHLVKNAPRIFERWSSNRVIEANVQGVFVFHVFYQHEYLITLKNIF